MKGVCRAQGPRWPLHPSHVDILDPPPRHACVCTHPMFPDLWPFPSLCTCNPTTTTIPPEVDLQGTLGQNRVSRSPRHGECLLTFQLFQMCNAVKEEQVWASRAPVTKGYNSQLQTGQYSYTNRHTGGMLRCWGCHEVQSVSPKLISAFIPYIQDKICLGKRANNITIISQISSH